MRRLVLILSLFISSCATNNGEKEIPVLDYSKKTDSVLVKESTVYKPNDLVIESIPPFYRDSSYLPKAAYRFTAYRLKSNKLVPGTDFIALDDNIFDKAFYKWANDSVVNIRMYHSKSKLTERFRITYYKNGNTGMERLKD